MADWGYDFTVVCSNASEVLDKEYSAKQTVKILSLIKAQSVYETVNKNATVIGADTVVEFNGKILGKPTDISDARNMLTALSGKNHFVYTGFTVISSGKVITKCVKSVVKFNKLTPKFIEDYLLTGSPLDKAGAYGIQDGGIVKRYVGSYENIVGLPIQKLSKVLKKFKIYGKK